MLLYCLSLLFIIATILQIGFLFLLRYRKQSFNAHQPAHSIPVSVIICARNESHNLQQFLPFVLQQDYPQNLFEVIVVDDQSTDDSAIILKAFAQQYPNLRITTIPVTEAKTLPGKKYALSKGIAAAKHERLLLTDADCKPASDKWLQTMTAAHVSHSISQISNPGSHVSNLTSQISLGYGAYEQKQGILNKFIRWETVNTCMQYASYAAAGLPYMGVGRNLCYDKSLLHELENDKAFQEIYRQTPSGDDDLLISRMADQKNTVVCLDKAAHTISAPQTTWKAWWRQKTRHSSTGKYYPAKTKMLLGLYALSHSLYWFLGILILLLSYNHMVVKPAETKSGIWNLEFGICHLPLASCNFSFTACLLPFALFLFLLRLFLYWINAAQWYKQLNEKKLSLFYPLGDLGWAVYNVLLSPYIFWKNKQAWK